MDSVKDSIRICCLAAIEMVIGSCFSMNIKAFYCI
jgi:hypothetical protein